MLRLLAILAPVAVAVVVAAPSVVGTSTEPPPAPAVPPELVASRSQAHAPEPAPVASGLEPAWAYAEDPAAAPEPDAGGEAGPTLEPSIEEDGSEVVFFDGSDAPAQASPQSFSEEDDVSAASPPSGEYDGQEVVPIADAVVRAAFYYPWFPGAWSQEGVSPFTVYRPSLGFYGSGNLDVVRSHIRAMQYGHISAGISSWWGQGDATDQNFDALLRAAAGTGFRWVVYYEPEGWGNPTVERIRADLDYIRRRYAGDPSYLRLEGRRFVVFVYSSAEDRCEMVERWRQAASPDVFVVLKAFPHREDCGAAPDLWHYYNPLVYEAALGEDSYAVSPGYAKPGSDVVLARDLDRWRRSVQAMADSSARFQLVVTFNEWGEGTAVESAEEWSSPSGYGAYLDVLHEIAP